MKKKILFFLLLILIFAFFISCEYYTTSANKLFTFRGEVADPVNTTPYENFEVQQQLAIRDDHVTVMFAKSLTIDNDTVKYIGIDGGLGGKSTANILKLASNGGLTQSWPSPDPSVVVHCQLLGYFDGAPVWGVIIPKSNFVSQGMDDDTLIFSWKFVWGMGWDGNEQAGVAPFINPDDFNNCTARLYASDYTTAADF